MIATMKYRLKPTKTQVAVMYHTLDVCRETHNLSLETKIVAYENSKVHLSNFDLTGMYTHAEIGKGVVHSLVIFDVARRVMQSFQNFYDKRARFPKLMSTLGVILLTEGSDELIARYTLLKYNTAR